MNLVQELTGGGVTTVTFLTGLGLDEMFTRTENTATSTFLTDALGSTLALADATGALQTDYTYDPFGETSTSGVTSTNAVQFTGRENDGVGLYFYRSRFYNPMSHRFISTDPLGLAAGVNLYAYVLNAPTIHVDPLGQQSVTPFPWWYWFFKVLNMEPPMPVDLAEQAHTIEEATKVGEKGIEEANKHVERRRETIKDLCAQDPSWPYCKSDDPNKPDPPKKKSKSDDPDQEPNSPW
jgi:RHS repeat-associated protein